MTTNKIIINSSVFVYALEYVKKAMVKNPAVPILENFLLSVANGMMKISGNDLQTTLSMTIPIEAKQGTEFKACLSPESLKYLKKLDKQPVTLEYDDESYSIVLLDDSGRAKYSGDNTENFPLVTD